MSKKAQKYIVVLLTVWISMAFLPMTASAQLRITKEQDDLIMQQEDPASQQDIPDLQGDDSGTEQVNAGDSNEQEDLSDGEQVNSGDSDEQEDPSDSEQVDSGDIDGGSEDLPASDGTGNVDEPQDNETISVKLDYNDGSGIRIVNVEPGTQVQTLSVPPREGYVFEYWTMNDTQVMPSFAIYSEVTLVAQWKEAVESSSKPASYASVDTHQQEVERAASQAEAATSDPDILSSEDWNSILSTDSEASSNAETVSDEGPSTVTPNGGSSWLFPLGITLIVLSACGIGTFIYLQFFSDFGPRGPGAGSGGGHFDDADMEFVDISSHSGGLSSPTESTPPKKAQRREPADLDETRPIPRVNRYERDPKGRDMSRSQAKQIDANRKEFDWDKFFNDEI